jgi:dTDP-4-dehydrorhamnose 3,5-epimerase
MKIINTELNGAFILEPTIFKDDRGYFFESYNKKEFDQAAGNVSFIQDNESFSSKGVVRGLHFQYPPYSQAKLVRCTEGEVLDIIVDLRPNSSTFKKWISVLLTSENKKQLFVPKGFGHGFVVLSENARFCYKVDSYYSKEHEGGIIFNDEELSIDWLLSKDELSLSRKDLELPSLSEICKNLEAFNI